MSRDPKCLMCEVPLRQTSVQRINDDQVRIRYECPQCEAAYEFTAVPAIVGLARVEAAIDGRAQEAER